MCAAPMGMMAAGGQRPGEDVLAAWAEGLAGRRGEVRGRGRLRRERGRQHEAQQESQERHDGADATSEGVRQGGFGWARAACLRRRPGRA